MSDSSASIIASAYATADAIAHAARAAAAAISEAARSLNLPSTSNPSSVDSPHLPVLAELCRSRDFFYHDSYFIREFLPTSALGYFWLLKVKDSFDLFDNANLNLAASYIRHYIQTQDSHDWFHVMVKVVSFQSFLDAMNKDCGVTRTLAFSCWCDGGYYEETMYRQHRHLIVVSPKGHFETHVWSRVVEFPIIPSKAMKRIRGARHLMNTLGYLSKRKSRCEFTLKGTYQFPAKRNHFYIFKTLPVGFRIPLATQWDNGILQLLYQEKFLKLPVDQQAERLLIHQSGHTRQEIGDYYDLERNVVLPVMKKFSPTDHVTSHSVCLTRGHKLYFELDLSNECLNLEDWLQKQVRGGNVFYDAIEDELWNLRFEDQKEWNEITGFEKIQVLEEDNRVLRKEVARLKKLLKKQENFRENTKQKT